MLFDFLRTRRFKFLGNMKLAGRTANAPLRARYILNMKFQYRWFGSLHSLWDAIRYGSEGVKLEFSHRSPGVEVRKNVFTPMESYNLHVYVNGHSLYELLETYTRGEVHMESLVEFNYFDVDPFRDRDLATAFILTLRFHLPADATLFKLSAL